MENIINTLLVVIPFILTAVLSKLIFNFLAYKFVSKTSAIKDYAEQLGKNTIKKGFKFGLLADFLGMFSVIIVVALIVFFQLGSYASGLSDFLSIIFIGVITFIICPDADFEFDPFIFIVYVGLAVSAILIFLFNYFIVLKKGNLPKSERLFTAFTVTVISTPYYYLIPYGWFLN